MAIEMNTSSNPFGSVLGAASGLLSGIVTNITNRQIAQENIDYQRWANQRNEELTRESWAREDNAVQRRVADLKAAGLNPLLAAGSAAASSGATAMQAPQNKFEYQSMADKALNSLLMSQQFATGQINMKNALIDSQIKSAIEKSSRIDASAKGLDLLDKLQQMVNTGGIAKDKWQRIFNVVMNHMSEDGNSGLIDSLYRYAFDSDVVDKGMPLGIPSSSSDYVDNLYRRKNSTSGQIWQDYQ